MIRIKAVDKQNILEVCRLKTNQENNISNIKKYSLFNAISIAQAKYNPELYPNAIYNKDILIGFFLYKRTENQVDTAVIYHFMLDNMFQHQGLEEKALEYILKGLKNTSC